MQNRPATKTPANPTQPKPAHHTLAFQAITHNLTLPSCTSVLETSCACMSHTCAVPSRLPVTAKRPLLVSTTHVTSSLCPVSTCRQLALQEHQKQRQHSNSNTSSGLCGCLLWDQLGLGFRVWGVGYCCPLLWLVPCTPAWSGVTYSAGNPQPAAIWRAPLKCCLMLPP